MKKIYQQRLLCLFFFFFFVGSTPLFAYDATVALDGTGDYTSVKAAINAAPTGRTQPWVIFIKNGVYFEKDTVPSNKPFLQLVGESVTNTIITFNAGASDPAPGGGTYGTQGSASFSVNASDFSAFNITFSNTYGDGSQAVALLVNADRAAFKNCRFLGNQDTVYTKGSGAPRHYFKNCYIDGNVDFIFGSSIAVFDSCVVYAKARPSTANSYITAANTPAGQAYGYVFRDCKIPSNTGATSYFLGRPWQNSNGSSPLANNKTVYLNNLFGTTIKPEGWSTWDAGTNTALIYYGEYKSKNFDGSPASIASRVAWSYQLADADAANYTNANLFGDWDPCAVADGFCNASPTPLAVSNFAGIKAAGSASFSWNISWPMAGVAFELFRSTNNKASFDKIADASTVNDADVNFSSLSNLPPAGEIYYYYLVASKAGFASHITDTVEISSKATLVLSPSSLEGLMQNIGYPQSSKSYTLTGSNLTGNVLVIPTAGFEVALVGGSTWYTEVTPLELTPSDNSLSANIQVRLSGPAAGDYTGIVWHITPEASATLDVKGSATTDAPLVSNVLQQWPLSNSNAENMGVRAPGVQPSVPTFKNLFVSNGTIVPAVPGYSDKYGQAFGVSSNGDGGWGTALGGPGGSLNRNFYEQFTISPADGYRLRLDSLVFNAAFYGTSSGTKLALVYSLSGFSTDSTELAGGTGPAGSLPADADGGFASPIVPANQTGGITSLYRLAFANGTDGVVVQPGQSLTVRLYFTCSSSSTGRFALLKNMVVKGEAISALPVKLFSLGAAYETGQVNLSWTATQELGIKQYDVEYSASGTSFDKIGSVAASGMGADVKYTFADKRAPAGNSLYYRLKIWEMDGTFTYSQILLVRTVKGLGIAVYPNPATRSITLLHDKIENKTAIRIYSADGRQVALFNANRNVQQTTIPIANLAKGTYMAVMDNGAKQQVRFVKM